MHKSEKSQKSPNFLREFCVGKPVGYAEILTFGNIFCTFYLTVKKVLQQGYFSSGSPALTYSGLSTPNAPLPPQKPSALHIRIFRHRTPIVSRRNRQTKFLDSTEPKALTYSNLSPTNVTPCSNRSHRTKFFDFHRNHQTDPLAVYRNRRTEPIAAHQSHQGNPVPSAGKKKNIQPDLPAGTAEGTPRHPQTKEKHTKPNYTPDEKRRQNIGTR